MMLRRLVPCTEPLELCFLYNMVCLSKLLGKKLSATILLMALNCYIYFLTKYRSITVECML